ncbi:CCA tRNA nucleotidyltransferase [Sediminibacillus dalangtanensis]|uniref:CCA-adding enzyme n=1 Tax=Sediminibacillus dalangtanensis TaxID=2729421 RepID=A0ABX7VVL2_9BACI|nr:CCA tRNA nucleotidyltransferase [Sediminibacillus dalangtanensis]QTM99635.1 CCA tRNA nucleotidyltransferase [Sediminibacillus dalangtanensis]
MEFPAFSNGKNILEKLERHGYSAFFVGGAVRDFLIGRPIGDIDITTSAKPEQVKEVFPKVIPVGIEHGTVIVRHNGESFEVTTFRVEEGYSDFRHPDEVEFVDDLEKDLARRDFTMNAIAMDKQGKVIDPYYGRKSIKNKMIRTVGNPSERFSEDPLRMLRALRFASQLDFQLDSETFSALADGAVMIKEISTERITGELEKLFAGPYVSKGVELLRRSNLVDCLPVFKENRRLQDSLRQVKVPFGQLSELICMLVYWDKQVTISEWTKAWKLSNRTKKEAEQLYEAISYSRKKQIDAWLVYQLPSHLLDSFIRLHTTYFSPVRIDYINHLIHSLPIRQKRDLSVTGKDLIQWFPERKKGPWINQALTSLEKLVVIGELPNQKNVLKEWLKHEYHPQSTD